MSVGSDLRQLDNKALKIKQIVERSRFFDQREDDNELFQIRALIADIRLITQFLIESHKSAGRRRR